MMEDRVAVVTNARHFIGPVSVKVLADFGARVI
jgi:crotonobetainyl-CoA:carnitine CoA-transferase CaiB-like acyl-CoA transferase